MMMMMMMMNCFCGMVDRRKAFSLISSWDHCQRSSPLQISDTLRAEDMLHSNNLMASTERANFSVHFLLKTFSKINSENIWKYFFMTNNETPTTSHKIFETNSSFHVK